MREKLNFPQKLGLLLILVSSLVLLGTEVLTNLYRSEAREIAAQLESRLPGRREGDVHNYSDPAMPVLQIHGTDFVGLLEVPSFGVTLPIGNSWSSTAAARYPCRFLGSAYDNSLILGGANRKGQLDFCEKLDLGDRITVTDMTGTEFSYEVVRIDRRDSADIATLQEDGSDLTLFVRSKTWSGYVIVRCAAAPGTPGLS